MNTKEIKKKLGLGDGYKRVAKAKCGDLQVRLFAIKDDDGELEECAVAVERPGGGVELANFEKADAFSLAVTNFIKNHPGKPIEAVKEYLGKNREEFIIASLGELRWYPGVSLAKCLRDLEDIVAGKGTTEELYDEGGFDIEMSHGGEDGVNASCFRLSYEGFDDGLFSLVTD